jgi:hypothetical protein
MKIDSGKFKIETTDINGVDVYKVSDLRIGDFPFQVDIYPEIKGTYMASYMSNSYWTSPFWGEDIQDIPEKTQFILWKNDYVWHGIFAFADGQIMSRFRGGENKLIIQVTGGRKSAGAITGCICLYSSDTQPEQLMKKIAAAGKKLSPEYIRLRDERRYPKLFDKLGWCSWDAMDIRVNSEDVVKKAQEFSEKNVPVKWFILDDMWADVKNLNILEKRAETSLYSFGPDIEKFPGGLKPLTDRLKSQYDIDTGVWYTVQGYWNGIDPDGDIAKELADDLTYDITLPHAAKEKRKVLRPKSDADSQRHFHDSFCRELRKDGISFVKVDNQSGEERMWQETECVPYVARNVHDGIESAVGKYFDMKLINCMGMAIQDFWNRPTSAINRNSGDFLPENNESFVKHAIQNAYNSFTYGQIMWPDWDMWWTDEANSIKSGVLRGISGGPIYVSDKLGRTDADKILPLITSDGTILRFDKPGVPSEDILLKNPIEKGMSLKIINKYKDMGAIAAFTTSDENECKKPIISLQDNKLLKEDLYVAYEFFSETYQVLDGKKETLCSYGSENVLAFSMCPIRHGFSVIGLKGKYFPGTTINTWCAAENAMQCTVKDSGNFMFYSENKPRKVIVNGKERKYQNKENIYYVELSKKGENYISVIL